MDRLTESQREALVMLLSGPKETARYTHFGYINGTSAAALVRKGYAKRLYKIMPSGMPSLEFQIVVTDAGVHALYENEKVKP